MTGAVDADLTTTATAAGDARHLAGGVELWVSRLVGVRGGVSVNTVGDARRAFSAGASVGAKAGIYVDAHVTRGDDELTRGWGFGLRVTF